VRYGEICELGVKGRPFTILLWLLNVYRLVKAWKHFS